VISGFSRAFFLLDSYKTNYSLANRDGGAASGQNRAYKILFDALIVMNIAHKLRQLSVS
jgi:hypothetical protein